MRREYAKRNQLQRITFRQDGDGHYRRQHTAVELPSPRVWLSEYPQTQCYKSYSYNYNA